MRVGGGVGKQQTFGHLHASNDSRGHPVSRVLLFLPQSGNHLVAGFKNTSYFELLLMNSISPALAGARFDLPLSIRFPPLIPRPAATLYEINEK